MIVTAGKYVNLSTAAGSTDRMAPKPDSVLVCGIGDTPVRWANGSKGDEISLRAMETRTTPGGGVLFRDDAGKLYVSIADPAKGKQMLVSEAGATGWQSISENKNYFNQADIELLAPGEEFDLAVFTKCATDGKVRLMRAIEDPVLPAGMVQMFAGTKVLVPEGWMICEGAVLSKIAYPLLFGAIGYNFGGAGDSFNLPDLRGRFPRGADPTGVNDPGAALRTNVSGGNVGGNVGSLQEDMFQYHDHLNAGKVFSSFQGVDAAAGQNQFVAFVSQHYKTGGIDTAGAPRWGPETRPKNISMNFIISTGR